MNRLRSVSIVLLFAAALISTPSSAQQHVFVDVALGAAHTCARTGPLDSENTGGIQCWGDNTFGQLGSGNVGAEWSVAVPNDVVSLTSRVGSITTGGHHTCAAVYPADFPNSGRVECWGDNQYGQLGDGTNENRAVPTQVQGLSNGFLSRVAAGKYHTCVAPYAAPYGVKCWGSNSHGQLGNGSAGTSSSTPVDVPLLNGILVTKLIAGDDFTCAADTSSHITCWGANASGQLADGTFGPDRASPGPVSGLDNTGATPVAAGGAFGCGNVNDGAFPVRCWGANDAGQLGHGSIGPNQSSAVDVIGLNQVLALAAGSRHACALLQSGGVQCWGADDAGQLGDGVIGPDRPTTLDVVGLTSGIIAIATGGNHSCAVTAGNWIKCWGSNASGELGVGYIGSNSANPIDVVGYSLLAPPTATKSFSSTSVVVGGSTQMTITLTNPNSIAINNLSLADNYPAGMKNAASNVVVSNTCGGTIMATDGGSSVALSNFTLAPGTSCAIVINVIGTAPGNVQNQTGFVFSANAHAGSSAVAALTVDAPANEGLTAPSVVKSFNPSVIAQGSTSTMTITLTNPNGQEIVRAAFNDAYPTGMVNASTGVVQGNTCGGTLTATADGATTTLSNGTVPANSSCSVSINVVGMTAGSLVNHTGVVTSNNAPAGKDASGDLVVMSAPQVAKAFSPSSIPLNGPSSMTITLTNPNPKDIVGATLSDTYPPGLLNASGSVVQSNTCGGKLTASADGSTAALSGGTIPANSSCSMLINVVGVAAGSLVNHSGTVTSTNAPNGGDTIGTLVVMTAPTITKAFNPSSIPLNGSSTMTITLTNPNSEGIVGAAFSDTYPSGMVNASTSVVQGNTCGGIVAASADGSGAALSNGSVPANSTCSVAINVVGLVGGSLVNHTGPVTSSNAIAGDDASGTLVVMSAPTVTKSFNPSSIPLNGSSTMTITLSNGNSLDITDVKVTDQYPVGLVNASIDTIVSNSCGGTFVAIPGGTSSALTNATLVPGASCSVVVNTIAKSIGTLVNHTGAVVSTNAAPGADAQAALTVKVDTGGIAPFVLGDGMVVSSGGSANTVNGNADSVLANDVDPNVGGHLIVTAVSNPAHGTLSQFDANGHFVYVNSGDGFAEDTFTYQACDSVHPTSCNKADVKISVFPAGVPLPIVQLPEAVNDAAMVHVGGTTSKLFDGSDSVLVNDFDPNTGGALIASPVGSNPSFGLIQFASGMLPSGGTFTYSNGGGGSQDKYYYAACDNLYGACSLATMTINIVPFGQPFPTVQLPVAVDDEIQVAPNGTKSMLIGGGTAVLWNDTDPNNVNNDNSTLQAWLIGGGPKKGTLQFNVAVAGDGTFTYQNTSGLVGKDSFSYQACDITFGACAAASVSIDISSNSTLNNLPTPAPDSIAVASGGKVNILSMPSGATSVLSNDMDSDTGETATLKAFLLGSGPQHGTLALGVDGSFLYSNDGSDSARADSFEYEACDIHGACAATTVSINIGASSGVDPTVTCVLPPQVYLAGTTSPDGTTNVVSIDMSKLFAPPAGNSLVYAVSDLPIPPLSVNENTGMLYGMFGGGNNGTLMATLTATAVPTGTTASEIVKFDVLSAADHMFRNGFDIPPQRCQ